MTQTIWTFLNSGTGMMISGAVILFILNKLFDAKPGWAKHEGIMIQAVKLAGKYIPNGSDGLIGKADLALEYFIAAYKASHDKEPSKQLKRKVVDGLSIVHDKLEENGTLRSGKE